MTLFEQTATSKVKIALLLILGIAHILVTAFYTVPGHLLIDEIIYHWSVRDFAATGQLSVWNGYEEFPSPELVHPFLSVHEGKLYTQYPMVFTALATPFYKVAGYFGLFILNSIAFLITVLLCFETARRMFRDIDLALNACLIFSLASFAWEYSQAAWPHMLSTCFALGAFYLFVCSYQSASKKRAIAAAVGAGIIAGLGPGLRFDSIYVVPALILPLMLSRQPRIGELIGFVAGTAPGLLICSYINYLRFGIFSALADGHGLQMGYPLLFPPVAIVLAWILNRSGAISFALNHRGKFLCGIFIVLLPALLIPQVQFAAKNLLHCAYVNTLDIRAFDQDVTRPAMSRSEDGGVVYMGAQKKALLQSMPFLALLIIPVLGLFRKSNLSNKFFILLLMPLAYIVGFAYTFYAGSLEGGLCLNLRYFMPIIPLLAILSAYGIWSLQREFGVSFSPLTMLLSGTGTSLLYFVLVEKFKSNVNDLVFPLLIFPLLLSLFLACSVLIRIYYDKNSDILNRTIAALVVIALTWSGLVAFAYDYPVHRRQRANNYAMGNTVLKVVPTDSLFLTAPFIDPFMGLIEQRLVRIAFPILDRFNDFSRLLQFHLASGRKCFAVFPHGYWQELRSGPLAPYEVKRLLEWPSAFLGEISVVQGSSGATFSK